MVKSQPNDKKYFSNPIIIDSKQMFEKPQMNFCFDVHDGINMSRQLIQPLIDNGIPFIDNINNGKMKHLN